MRLFTSERFQKEYQKFSRVLAEIDHEETKKQLDSLLNDLVREVKAIDMKHEELLLQQRLPSTTGDTKNNLLEIRRKIDRIVKDCERSKSIIK